MPPPTSDDIDVKEDHLNCRIIRYFNLPPYLSDPSSASLSPLSTLTPTLTIHRSSQTYALSSLSAKETRLNLLPASEARQFANKDIIVYLDSVAQTKVLFHDLWKLWYPLRRGDMWEESNQLERFLAAPIRLPSSTTTPIPTLIHAHNLLIARAQQLQDEMEAPRMPNQPPNWSKGLFKISQGCASCFLVVGKRWREEFARVVCRGGMLGRLGEREEGWMDVIAEGGMIGGDGGDGGGRGDGEGEGEKEGEGGSAEGKGEEEGWQWKAMALEEAVRTVIALGGEEGRFKGKVSSAYFREYYEGEG